MHGSCLCGKVTFDISVMPRGIYQCHCQLCRKQGGSASNSATIIKADHFRWITGQALIASYVRETGFRSDFCTGCGSIVPNPLRNRPYYWVPVGLLDGDPAVEIVAHLFVGAKAGWESRLAAGTCYQTMPDLSELIALLDDPRDRPAVG